MSEAGGGWLCPGCGRHVPPAVDTCRCGLSRSAAAALTRPAPPPEPLGARLVRVALGYSGGVALSPGTRALAGAGLLLGAAAVYAGTSWLLREPRRISASDVRVVARLDEYTRSAGQGMANTIPGFLALPGELGAMVESGDGVGATLQSVSQSDLRSGTCTSSLPRLVRQTYPDAYDGFSDDELERRVLETHPEYEDRLCALPAWIPMPHEIVKYEMPAGRATSVSGRGRAWAGFTTLLFAVLALNAYFRLAARSVPAPSGH